MVENSHDKHIEEETEPSGRLGRLVFAACYTEITEVGQIY